MRFPAGETSLTFYIYAVDSTDFTTPETGKVTGNWTTRSSQNGGVDTSETPVITEVQATNQAGVYKVVLTKTLALTAGNDSEEIVFHISATGVAPIVRTIEIYRRTVTPGDTLATTSGAVDTTTTNTDMRGTDSANTVVPPSVAQFNARTRLDADYFSWATDTVATVTTLTNLPTITTDWLTAAGTAADFTTEIQAGLATETKQDAAQTDLDTITDSGVTLTAAGVDLIWDEDIIAAHTTADSAGLILANTRSLTSGAGGISVSMDSFTKTTGGTETNSETDTVALDGIYHIVPPTGSVLDVYYEFNVGVTGVATEILWDGYVRSNNDNCEVYGYDWVTAGWIQVGSVSGTNSATAQEHVYIITNAMTGTAANAGVVRFRFASDGADVLTELGTDRILCEYTTLPAVAGVLHSGIAVTATSNTITLDSGASPLADFYNHAKILIVSGEGAEQERIIVDYTVTTQVAKVAPPWITTPDNTSAFEIIGGIGHAETGWNTIKIGLGGAFDSTTTIELDSDASALDDFYNGKLIYLDAGAGEGQERVITDYVGASRLATVHTAWTVNPDATSEYIVEQAHPYIDGAISTLPTAAENADAVWDESSLDHLTAYSTGIAQYVGQTPAIDTVMTGTPTTTTLRLTNGSTVDDYYNDQMVFVFDGSGNAQARPILSYVGATKEITVDEAWVVTPLVGERAMVILNHVHPLSQIADKVWDEATAGHATAGTTGKAVIDILADTADIQPKIGTPAADVSADIAAVKAETVSILEDTGTTLPAGLASIEATVDAILAMLDDNRAEPGQGAPPSTADLATKVDYLYKIAINKKTNDGTINEFYNAAGTVVDHKETTAEAAGTVTIDKMVSGP